MRMQNMAGVAPSCTLAGYINANTRPVPTSSKVRNVGPPCCVGARGDLREIYRICVIFMYHERAFLA